MKCPVCLSKNLEEKIPKYLTCLHCGTLFLKDYPSLAEIQKNNEADTLDRIMTDFDEVSPIYSKRLEMIKKFMKGEKILDVGYGNGVFMQLANRKGFKVFGVETSDKLIKYMEGKGFEVSKSIKGLKKISLDAVVSFDVIEHTKDPNKFLSEINMVMKKDGILIVTTPNAEGISGKFMRSKYFVFNPVKHYIIFSRKSLRLLFKINGFKTIDFKTDIITPWFLPTDKTLNKILNKIVYLISYPLQGYLFKYGMGDNLQLIARKK